MVNITDIERDSLSENQSTFTAMRKAAKVAPRVSLISAFPGDKTFTRDFRLLNHLGGEDINIDGSSEAQYFTLKPDDNEIYVVDWISLVLIDPGQMLPTNFGSMVGPLTNGLEVIYKNDQVELQMTKCKDNIDLVQCFFGGQVNNVGTGNSDPGLFDTPDFITGQMLFNTPAIIDGSQNEEIGLKISDNLSSIAHMRASIRFKTLLIK